MADSSASPKSTPKGPRKMRVITKKKVASRLGHWKMGPEKVQSINEAITEIMASPACEEYKKSLKAAFKEEFSDLFVNYLESLRLASTLSIGLADSVVVKPTVSQNKIIQSRNIFSIFYLFLKEKDIYADAYEQILVKKFLADSAESSESKDMASEVLAV